MLIIFDFDDTLIETTLDITSVLLNRFTKKLVDLGVEANQISLAERFWKYYYECSSSAVAARLLLAANSNQNNLESALEIFQNPDLHSIEIKPIPGAMELLKQLKKEHQLVLCTRGNLILQKEKMKKSGIEPDFFDKIYAGLEDKGKYYQEILSHFKIDPKSASKSVVVCGDKVLFDLVPAKQLGCTTVQFLRPFRNVEEQLSSFVDHQIKNLDEFLPIIQQQ